MKPMAHAEAKAQGTLRLEVFEKYFWVAVKEFKLSYYNIGIYIHIYIYMHTYKVNNGFSYSSNCNQVSQQQRRFLERLIQYVVLLKGL